MDIQICMPPAVVVAVQVRLVKVVLVLFHQAVMEVQELHRP
jgi:hypothetical protein